jgi:hypothetical protein
MKLNCLTFHSSQTHTENKKTQFADFLHPHLWRMEYKSDWNTAILLAVLEPGDRFFLSFRYNSDVLLRTLNITLQQSCKINRVFVFYTTLPKAVILL